MGDDDQVTPFNPFRATSIRLPPIVRPATSGALDDLANTCSLEALHSLPHARRDRWAWLTMHEAINGPR